MTVTRTPIIAWLLLLIAALAIGGLAFVLLRSEQQNLAMAAKEARRERMAAVAVTVDLTVTESREALASSLTDLPGTDPVDALESWRLDNPLVRNVFVWSPEAGLLFPNPHQPTRDEEAAFVQRFASLFAGQVDWMTARAESTEITGQVQARRELAELAKSVPAVASTPAEADISPSRLAGTGWLPWFWQDGLHVLIWAEQADGLRFGIELEMAALLSRLVTVLPEPYSPDETWAILNDRGEVVHQRGPADLSSDRQPDLTVPLGSSLPHWQIGLYTVAGAESTEQSFLLLGGLLTTILVVAILLGGSLLLWQARRGLLDARRKTTFVSNVSHELKTPLTTIRMYAEMLEESGECDPGKGRRYLAVISSEAQRLTRLVNNLLDFSRMEQGRKQYHRQSVDLNELIGKTLAAQTLRLNEAGLELDLQLPEAPVVTETDGDAVEQTLLNLIDNAIKYAAAGKRLQVSMRSNSGRLEIRVADRGPGIPTAHLGRIFDTFHRVDSSLTTRQQGCGLGLSIARQLMRDLGGDLTCQQSDGGGACFTLSLPLSA